MMKIPKKDKFIVGGRIVKTGIAVFVTAFICHLLNWPAMFAVITAIVTIEPTVSDSIKKAFVRFPASVIGAALSVLFTFIFGDSPYSYALVTITTIIACHKLNLQEGTLVATLTGVAMISTVHDHFFSSLFIRLGTTSTGLIVSTLVNLLVMPPNYSKTITNQIQNLFIKAGEIVNKKGMELCEIQTHDKNLRSQFQSLVSEIEKAETICQYQKEEWRFHRYHRRDIRNFHYEYKKLNILRQLTYHIGNLIYLPSYHLGLDPEKRGLISEAFQSFHHIFLDPNHSIVEDHHKSMKMIIEWFQQQKELMSLDGIDIDQHHISPETAILYELLAMHDLTEELNKIRLHELRHQKAVLHLQDN